MANVICRAINVFEKESKQVAAADAAMKATTELLSMLELEASSQASAEPTVKKKPKNKKKGKWHSDGMLQWPHRGGSRAVKGC